MNKLKFNRLIAYWRERVKMNEKCERISQNGMGNITIPNRRRKHNKKGHYNMAYDIALRKYINQKVRSLWTE